jgi:endonuclease/exonuclease/phosphatase family metal-dependent hydrolase
MRKAVSVVAWTFAVAVAFWAVLRLTGWDVWYPAVQVLAFTPYAMTGAAMGVPVILAMGQRKQAIVLGVSAAVLAFCVLPRGIAGGEPLPAGPTLRVASANLLVGGADATELVTRVRSLDVDVLAVQEMTPQWLALADSAGISAVLPYRFVAPASLAEGSAVFSRYPLTDAGSRLMALGWFQQVYCVVHAPGAAPVRLESAHAASPYNAEMIQYWASTLEREPSPGGILLGDFNATLDHGSMRDLLDRGWRDAASLVGQGFVPTWGPFEGDPVPPVTIDHVLIDDRLGVRSFDAYTQTGSDHRMIVATLVVPRAL